MRGVGFLLGEQAAKALIRYNRISSRVISARFATMPFDITVIHTYAPTSSWSDDDKESFYSDVEDALTQIGHQLWESTGIAIETDAESASWNLPHYTTCSSATRDSNRNRIKNGRGHHQMVFIGI